MPKTVSNYRLFTFLLALAALLLSNQAWLHEIDESVYSMLIRTLPGKTIGQDVAIVAIDQPSISKYGSWPWSANTLANLMRSLKATGIVSQTYLPPLVYPESASQTSLASAIAQSGAIFLSAPYYQGQQSSMSLGDNNRVPALNIANPNTKGVLGTLKQWALGQSFATEQIIALPAAALSKVAKGLGVSESLTVTKSSHAAPLLIADDKHVLPSLSLLVAANVLDTRFKNIRLSPDHAIKLGKHVLKLDENFRYRPYPIRKTDSKNKIHAYSAAAVLEKKVTRSKLRNKVVIVGLGDNIGQGHAARDGKIENPLWTAFVLQSMLSELSIWRPFWVAAFQKVLIVVFMLYLMFLPLRYQGRIGLGIGAVLFIVLINIELLGLLVYHAWIPLVFPALFLLVSHFLVSLRHQLWTFVCQLQTEVSDAYRALASSFLSQGKLDDAFANYQHCGLTPKLLQDLYLLAIEYERRRQFSKALIVYEHITQFDPNYRDIKERRERHFSNSDKISLISTMSGNFSETLVVDDPNIAQPVLGRYEIVESIGKGAMGMVFLGKDPKIGRTVAIKTLPLSKEFDTQQLDSVRSRFYQEAETAGRLSHPNIVTIYDVGEEHDLAYIAMDYIAGSSLEKYTRPGYLLSVAEVFIIGITVADALDYAHKQNVVHRDIKPANVMYDPDERVIKVTDFGIACLTDKSKTMTGTVLGSPSYMSPEQLEGKKLSGRSDIFSLGVTLFQLFTGTLPFNAETMASLAYKIANEKPISVRKVRSELPGCLTRVINKALEKNTKQRYQTGGEMADALRKCAS